MSKELNRKQLYKLVWEQPISQIAKEYGLSDRGLGKLCERNAIPTPPRGYWAKIQSGQKIKKPPLLFADSTNPDKTILSKTQRVLSSTKTVDKEEIPDELKELIEYEQSPENKIKIPKKLSKYHPIIEKAERERLKWDKKTLNIIDRRRNRILSEFLYALEERGYKAEYNDNIYRIKISHHYEDYVFIGISQYIKRYKRNLTESELKNAIGNSKWVYENEPTGFLMINLYSCYGRISKNFIETESTPLENLLNDAIIEIAKDIFQQRNSRLKRWEEERKHYEKQEQIRKEKEKRVLLVQETDNWIKAKNIRAYVNAVIENRESSMEIESWSKWALNYADEIDPLCRMQEDGFLKLP
ncbi:MAG: hypothetical protein PHC64_03430 [Candidatus Gastranaerophilales bacterium]|nr:hypothetical protein [Candidatus Gastranaerophilales bacterium]